MELRKHPLVSYRNQSSWPPAWIWIGGNENKHPRGEVGVLKQLKLVDGPFVNRCFLWMQYEDSMYLGCLLFSDASFCQQISKLLQEHCGDSIEYMAVWILHICYENNAGETFGVAGSTHVRESFLGTLMSRRDLVGPRGMFIARTCIPLRLSSLNS